MSTLERRNIVRCGIDRRRRSYSECKTFYSKLYACLLYKMLTSRLLVPRYIPPSGIQRGQLAAQHLLSSIPNLSRGSPLSNTTDTGIIAEEVTVGLDGLPVNKEKEEVDGSGGVKKTENGEREMGSVVVQIFVNKQGLGGALINVSTPNMVIAVLRCSIR